MPVVINEFEVVAAPQPAAEAAPAEAAPANPSPTPYEIERVVERQMERLARIWAH